MASLADPSLPGQRVELAKVVSLFHLMQDVFHFCGRIDPHNYMKICLKAVFDNIDEIAYKIHRDGAAYNPKRSLHNTRTRLCNALLGEAKWAAVGQFPKAEEYLKIANDTSGIDVVPLHTFFLLGEGTTRETVHLVNNDPPIRSSVSTIFRLWDGLGTSVTEARNHVMNKISDTWKQLKLHCLSPNPFSASFTRAALNIARLAPLIHCFEHRPKLPCLQKNIKSLLFDRIAV
ncbi:probable terpene synthase 4 [Hevea brasiliensis]|uniref:probable terpene synthase 4 n=1 Tax=Hevea brasiliensis TaxID=3981 RepID=UPI0025F67413|nr:probable terpene synthase 4 [Hevea brasiliensis]